MIDSNLKESMKNLNFTKKKMVLLYSIRGLMKHVSYSNRIFSYILLVMVNATKVLSEKSRLNHHHNATGVRSSFYFFVFANMQNIQ